MGSVDLHLTQAEHNSDVARFLLAPNPVAHDWAITSGFYAAIHFFEAALYFEAERHTEMSVPVGSNLSFHAWREQLVQKYLDRGLAKAYRKLRSASDVARYLTGTTVGAAQHFSRTDALELVDKQLGLLAQALAWCVYVGKLDLEGVNAVTGRVVRRKLLGSFDQKSFFARSEADLKRTLGEREWDLLRRVLTGRAISHPALGATSGNE